jgi:hypothetical protein
MQVSQFKRNLHLLYKLLFGELPETCKTYSFNAPGMLKQNIEQDEANKK